MDTTTAAEFEEWAESRRERTCGNDSANCRLHEDARVREGHAGGCAVHPYEVEEDELIREFELRPWPEAAANDKVTRVEGWLGNRTDSPATFMVTPELAREFVASKFYATDRPIWPAMTLWLAAEDGKNLAWDPQDRENEAALEALYHLVRDEERASNV